MDYYKRFTIAVSLLLGVIIFGTSGYMIIERAGLLDSLYMTLNTISTVGFREAVTLSPKGIVFTMLLMVAGAGILFYTLTTTVEFMLEGHLQGFLERRRSINTMRKMNEHFIICGYGKVGSQVASELSKHNVSMIVIEKDEQKIEQAKQESFVVIEGDASLEKTLLDAGIEKAKGLVAAVDTDADNVFIALTARGLNPGIFIVARADSEQAIDTLQKAGADRVVSPAVIGGRRMATMLVKPMVSDFLDVVTQGRELEFQLEELGVTEGSVLAEKTIREGQIRENFGVLILAIQKQNGELNAEPAPETTVEAGDKLLIIGTRSQIDNLNARIRA